MPFVKYFRFHLKLVFHITGNVVMCQSKIRFSAAAHSAPRLVLFVEIMNNTQEQRSALLLFSTGAN